MMSSVLALWTSVAVAFGGPVKEVRVAPGTNATEVVVAVDGVVEVRDFTMEGPHRLFIDLIGARNALDRETFAIRRGGIVSMTATQYAEDVVRLVLELEGDVAYDVYRGDGRVMIALENPGATFDPWTSGIASPVAMPTAAAAEQPVQVAQNAGRPFSIEFRNTPIEDVAFTFSEFGGRDILLGTGVTGFVNARIVEKPWMLALENIARASGWVVQEDVSGIIRIVLGSELQSQESFEPLITRTYPLNYAEAEEIAEALQGVVNPGQGGGGAGGGGGGAGAQGARGTADAVEGTNAVVVTAIQRIHDEVELTIQSLDIRYPSVSIQAKIIFVNRTDLNELGITYDLKDSRGNQLNLIAPGAIDANGDGVIDLSEETVGQGTNVVSLGGNSVAALGNANTRLPNPSLQLLSSLIIGRHTLINFIEALEQTNLSDVQAEPYQTVLHKQQARIQVGQSTPLRVLDAGAIGAGAGGAGAQAATATVDFRETGIILEATPTVANDGEMITLDLLAERSSAQIAESDVGFTFDTQNARSRVRVRDGETVVIGGLTVTEMSEVRSGIPMLMDLPLLGRLFRSTRQQIVQRDLIILVTPTIVRDGAN